MVVAVDPYLIDWLDLVFRSLHVIAGIVWIGTSFYFVQHGGTHGSPLGPLLGRQGASCWR